MNELTEAMVQTIQDAAKKMTGANRRAFEAQVTLDYLGGVPRLAETVFGWSRDTVRKGLQELRTGVVISDQPRSGAGKTEAKNPQLARDIRDLVEPQSQADPKFQTPFAYTRITAQAVRTALIEQKGYRDEDLPSRGTLGGCEKIDRHKPVAFARRPFFWTTAPVEEAVEVQLRRSWLVLLASVVVHSIAQLR